MLNSAQYRNTWQPQGKHEKQHLVATQSYNGVFLKLSTLISLAVNVLQSHPVEIAIYRLVSQLT